MRSSVRGDIHRSITMGNVSQIKHDLGSTFSIEVRNKWKNIWIYRAVITLDDPNLFEDMVSWYVNTLPSSRELCTPSVGRLTNLPVSIMYSQTRAGDFERGD